MILLLLGSSAFAITATYMAQSPLVFERGTPPLNTNKLVAHVGTIVISTDGNQLFHPNLVNINLSTSFGFSGPITWSNNWQTGEPEYTVMETYFTLYAVSTARGVTQVNPLWESDGSQPLRTEGGNINVRTLEVKIYLVSDQDYFRYQYGASYPLTTGSMEGFSLGVANNGSGYYDGNITPISVNNNPAGTTTPMLSGGSTTPNPLPYGPPILQPVYALSIIDENRFTITDAYGGLSTRIARANLHLSNAQANGQYGIDVVFSNKAKSPQFTLHLDGNPNLYSIPYFLLFNGQEVEGGKPIRWSNLVPNANYKDISITKVNALRAEMAPAGDYFDTITVTITPIDTL